MNNHSYRFFTTALAVFACAWLTVPQTVFADPFVVVANSDDDTLSVIDAAVNGVVRIIPTEEKPIELAVHIRNYVWALNADSNTITRYAAETGSYLNKVSYGGNTDLRSVFADHDRTYLSYYSWGDDAGYINTWYSYYDGLSQIDLPSPYPGAMALVHLPEGKKMYVAEKSFNWVHVMDVFPHSHLTTIPVGAMPINISASDDGTRVYVVNHAANSVSVIDTASDLVLGTVDTGPAPREVVVDPAMLHLYVTSEINNMVYVHDAQTYEQEDIIPVQTDPVGIAISPLGDRVYVVNSGSDTLSVIDTSSNQVIANIPVGQKPMDVVVTRVGILSIVPDVYDFGDVDVGSSASQSIAITNVGDASLVVNQPVLDGDDLDDFSVVGDDCGWQLGASATCFVQVNFAPVSVGEKRVELLIPTDVPDMPVLAVPLSGNGLGPRIEVIDTVEPFDDHTLKFALVTLGNVVVREASIRNTGSQDLVLGTIAGVDPVEGTYSLVDDNCSGQTMVSGATCVFGVRFEPDAASLFVDNFDIPSNDPDTPSVLFILTGSGANEPIGNLIAVDDLEPFDDHLLDFGDVEFGQTGDGTVLLFNQGNAGALDVSAVTISGTHASEFLFDLGDGENETCGPLPISVPGPFNPAMPPHLQPKPCTIAVQYAPQSAGQAEAALVVSSNDPGESEMTFSLLGGGLGPEIQLPSDLGFGEVGVGDQRTLGIIIANLGTTDLSISDISLSGSDAFGLDLVLGPDACGGTTPVLAPGATCSLSVGFAPQAEDALTGSVQINSNDADEASAVVALTGTGVAEVPDAGTEEDGTTDDGGADDGGGLSDVGTDAGTDVDQSEKSESGCGCSQRSGNPMGYFLIWLLLFAVVVRHALRRISRKA